jgi:enoyl-CoA hydratase/carnithine racemase
MSTSAVLVTRRGAASWARIARPEHGNACNSEVLDGLERWLSGAVRDPEARVLVLSGTGASFCGGADLREGTALARDPAALLAWIRRGRDLVDALAGAPLPTIAAVNGAAFAGGLELVLACDLVVAARSARFGDRHVRHAVVPGWGSSARLPRTISPATARRLLLTGEDIDADEARTLGLVATVVADDRLDAEADGLAERLASLPTPALTRILRLTRADLARPLDEALAAEWQALEEHVTDPAVADRLGRLR